MTPAPPPLGDQPVAPPAAAAAAEAEAEADEVLFDCVDDCRLIVTAVSGQICGKGKTAIGQPIALCAASNNAVARRVATSLVIGTTTSLPAAEETSENARCLAVSCGSVCCCCCCPNGLNWDCGAAAEEMGKKRSVVERCAVSSAGNSSGDAAENGARCGVRAAAACTAACAAEVGDMGAASTIAAAAASEKEEDCETVRTRGRGGDGAATGPHDDVTVATAVAVVAPPVVGCCAAGLTGVEKPEVAKTVGR